MRLLLGLLLAINCPWSFGQDNRAKDLINSISISELKEHVNFLASDECEGRETGSNGQKLAANYIREYFKSCNLTGSLPGVDNYFQSFDLFEQKIDSVIVQSNHAKLRYGIDFRFGSMKEKFSGSLDTEFVFVGFGLKSDYEGLDVKGKIAIYFEGVPQQQKKKSDKKRMQGLYIFTEEKLNIAKSFGALGGIQIRKNENLLNRIMEMLGPLSKSKMSFRKKNGATAGNEFSSDIMISHKTAARLIGLTTKELDKVYEKLTKGKRLQDNYSGNIQIQAYRSINTVSTENILAYCEGSENKDEVIVMIAHYDHLGKTDTDIFHGADDNATGVAALLEIAEAFSLAKKNGKGPNKSILFIAVSAEEKGLLGSEYYINNPPNSLENTSLCINMDMLGRSDSKHSENTNYVYVYTSESEQSDLYNDCKIAENVVNSLRPEYQFKEQYQTQGRSDHMSFENQGIPIIYYYTGTHKDYHRPSDTVDKINFENLTEISQLIFATAWEFAK